MNFPRINIKAVTSDLQALPTVTFALMLGLGLIILAVAAWLIVILAYGHWPVGESVALARIDKLGLALLVSLGLVGVVMITLAFGKVHRLSINAPDGISGSVSFDGDRDDPPAAPPA